MMLDSSILHYEHYVSLHEVVDLVSDQNDSLCLLQFQNDFLVNFLGYLRIYSRDGIIKQIDVSVSI